MARKKKRTKKSRKGLHLKKYNKGEKDILGSMGTGSGDFVGSSGKGANKIIG